VDNDQAAGGELPLVLLSIAKRAEAVGSTLEEAEVAVGELAHNLLDYVAAM
jgi:hypothetical protein